MGSIRKRDSTSKAGRRQRKPWEVRYVDPNGKPDSESFETYAEASQFDHQVELAKSRGTYTDPRGGRLTLAEWAAEWLGFHQVREATRKKNASFLDRHILPELGRMPLARIGERDYLRFVAVLSEKGLSPASVRSVTNTLTAILNSAVSTGLLVKSSRPARLRLPD